MKHASVSCPPLLCFVPLQPLFVLLVQAVQLQSWFLDQLMAPAAKLSLLQDLRAEQGPQMSPEQVEYLSRVTLEAEAEARLVGPSMDYLKLFGVSESQVSEHEVPALLSPCLLQHPPNVAPS